MQDDTSFIAEFLGTLKCEQYIDKFLSFQLTTSDDIQYLDQEILTELGIVKIGDRIRILSKSRLLRQNGSSSAEEIRDIVSRINGLCLGPLTISEELVTDKHSAIFILNDGSAKKVNVSGCFNADSIKKKLIKKLPSEFIAVNSEGEETRSSQDYDVFVVDYVKNVLHLLYDVELVTICHSSDRVEKNRLILVSKDQTPSDKAILTSKKLYLKTLSVIHQLGSLSAFTSNTPNSRARFHTANERASKGTDTVTGESLRIENTKDGIRQIFNQRPPSELISTNLAEYFPHTDMNRLKKTLRNSVRQSIRLSSIIGANATVGTNNVGNIWVNNSNAVGTALLQSLESKQLVEQEKSQNSKVSEEDTLNLSAANGALRSGSTLATAAKRPEYLRNIEMTSKSSKQKEKPSENSDHIELLNTDSDGDEEDEDVISLPTKIVTPKSWLKGARIGAGSFGSVYLGMNAQTGELMAVKQVELQPTALTAGISASEETKKHYNQGGNASAAKNSSQVHKKMIDALQHEMGLLKELHHENIVTYYGSSQEGGNLNIFLEYVPGGSVSSMLNNYGPFEEPLIKNFTRQILIGLSYLHRKNIIHRDIKGANILIDIKGCVKITDFGISKKLSPLNQQQNKRASLQGSVYWMAPEVVKQVVTTEKADIWSVGCVITEMFTGKHPFPDFSQMQAIFKIGTNTIPELPTWASDQAKDFLMKTFELDYKKRPSSIELLQHAWLDTSI
ncbi:LAFE_0D06700g1_1 [Lachancea fermentati]|uniref:Serine/threonine-protein kinase STE11 n=1 Tax=Lachancea fermentati TaxID=4955 RepID=A0A1G4MBK9_LACFM|nr:LAFE_0D06700g1_1 [Lachancea fermentati]